MKHFILFLFDVIKKPVLAIIFVSSILLSGVMGIRWFTIFLTQGLPVVSMYPFDSYDRNTAFISWLNNHNGWTALAIYVIVQALIMYIAIKIKPGRGFFSFLFKDHMTLGQLSTILIFASIASILMIFALQTNSLYLWMLAGGLMTALIRS